MRAYLKNYRQASRKVRLVADMVRGKSVTAALNDLSIMSQKSATALHKLISSALANAQQKDTSIQADDLLVSTITVDKGITYVRHKPRAFGRATPINRECAHVRVELAPVAKVTQKMMQTEVADSEKKATAKNNT